MSAKAQLNKLLEKYRDVLPETPGLVYRYGPDFVLRHGKWFHPKPLPIGNPRGMPSVCFGNAILLSAIHGYKYVEGYALPPKFSFPVHHAWNELPSGDLIDNTWKNEGRAYCGVEFSVERADDATWIGDASILNDYRRRFPLFRQEWKGEDYTIQWPKSERLDLLRAGDFKGLFEILEREYSNELL